MRSSRPRWELHLSHWSGELPVLEVYRHFTYGGQFHGLFGRFTYLGAPVHGFSVNKVGNPRHRDGAGRDAGRAFNRVMAGDRICASERTAS